MRWTPVLRGGARRSSFHSGRTAQIYQCLHGPMQIGRYSEIEDRKLATIIYRQTECTARKIGDRTDPHHGRCQADRARPAIELPGSRIYGIATGRQYQCGDVVEARAPGCAICTPPLCSNIGRPPYDGGLQFRTIAGRASQSQWEDAPIDLITCGERIC